jgi:hypothetical protein
MLEAARPNRRVLSSAGIVPRGFLAVASIASYLRRMEAGSPSSPGAFGDEDGFYVEPDCCLLCGVPEDIAPEIFETGAITAS